MDIKGQRGAKDCISYSSQCCDQSNSRKAGLVLNSSLRVQPAQARKAWCRSMRRVAGHSTSTVRKHRAGAQHPRRSSVTPPWEQPRVCVLGGLQPLRLTVRMNHLRDKKRLHVRVRILNLRLQDARVPLTLQQSLPSSSLSSPKFSLEFKPAVLRRGMDFPIRGVGMPRTHGHFPHSH